MIADMKPVEGVKYYPLPPTLEGYAVLEKDEIWLSLIISKFPGKGNFKRFLKEVEKKFTVCVPSPSGLMAYICLKRGYTWDKTFVRERRASCDFLKHELKKGK